MSNRVEWVGAVDTEVTIAWKGAEIGGDTIADRALIIGGDNPLVIEGSTAELLGLADRILEVVSQSPLTDEAIQSRVETLEAGGSNDAHIIDGLLEIIQDLQGERSKLARSA